MEVHFVTLEEELRKNPDVKQEDLRALSDWLDKQPHLPRVTDAELAIFLHSCYNRIEPTKEAIDTYFTVRTHAPDVFTERTLDSPGIAPSLTTVNQVLLPRGKNGYLMTLYQLNDTNAKNYSFVHVVKTWCVLIECWLARHGSDTGLVCCVDMKGVGLGHLPTSLSVLAKFFVYFQEALPVRIKGLMIFNASSVVDQLLALIKPFMKKELIEMLKVSKTEDVLHEMIDLEHLPSDYGGSLKSMRDLTVESSAEMIKTYKEYILRQEKRLVDETLRPGKAKTESDLFGVQGSFKKLDLD